MRDLLPWIICLLLLLWTIASQAQSGVPPPEGPLYEEDIAASNSGRVEQAKELETYLASLQESRAMLDALFKPDYGSLEAYAKSTRKLRQTLCNAIGYPPSGQPDAEWSQFNRIGQDSLATYYRTRFSVLPGVHTIGLFIVPKARIARAPLVIAVHGGGGSPELATFHGGANYHDMVRGAVQRGYVVWAPQHLFRAEGVPDDIRQRIDSRARLVGTSVTAIEIAKIVRGLDVLLRRPEVDKSRVAMVGLSYGGFYTLYTTALEPRIKVAVSSCWFNDRAERLVHTEPTGASDLRFIDGLRLFRDPEIVALICPRPLEIQMGIHDPLVPIEPARRTAPRAADYYKRLKLPENFRFVEFEGPHEWHGATAWEWLATHL